MQARQYRGQPGWGATRQVEHRNLSMPHPKLRTCLTLPETPGRPPDPSASHAIAGDGDERELRLLSERGNHLPA
jgi:hypothetical protein